MKRPKIIFILIVSLLFSCKKEQSEFDVEKEVFAEIFPVLVDSTYQDGRIYFHDFPPFTSLEARIKLLKKDSSKLVFAISEKKYNLDLRQYNTKKINFKNISEFPKDRYKLWYTKYDFGFAGVIYFSNLKLDARHEKGEIDVDYGCGTRCGVSYKISIKKINEHWTIEKKEITGVS